MSYKRRSGWWEEYGVYIQKSPSRDVWIVGFSGFGKRAGGPTWSYDTREAAEDDVENFITTFWDNHIEDFEQAAIEGGLTGSR